MSFKSPILVQQTAVPIPSTNSQWVESLEKRSLGQANSLRNVQSKLSIGSPDDPFEHEADSVANQIMRMPESRFAIQRKCAACEHEEEQIQRKPFNITPFIQKRETDGAGLADNAVSSQIESSRGGGSPMAESTRSFMETRFGNDFSGVKIHTDSNAVQLSRNLNAQAFTVGNDVFFNQGKYSPESDAGKQLLAHELVHTVQQGYGLMQVQKEEETTSPSGENSTEEDANQYVRIELPRPLNLSVNGIGVRYQPRFIQGVNGNKIDIAPFFGNKGIDFPLAALEALGIPILSYFAFHGGPLTAYRGMTFSNVSALSGGTSFVRNAMHYGYLRSDQTNLYGAPGSFVPSAYSGIPNLTIRANPMDIGTMIHVDYFNDPLEGHPNNPAVMFTLTSSFDSNPLEAITNIAGAIHRFVDGRLYTEPNVTHNYPEFNNAR